MLYTASLVDGKCPTCREREARQQKTPQKVAIDAEPPVPVDVEAEIREAFGQPETPKSSEMEISGGSTSVAFKPRNHFLNQTTPNNHVNQRATDSVFH